MHDDDKITFIYLLYLCLKCKHEHYYKLSFNFIDMTYMVWNALAQCNLQQFSVIVQSTSPFSTKPSEDTPFGLQGMKPNPFSKESHSQRDLKQIFWPWPVSHYILKSWPCNAKKYLYLLWIVKRWKCLFFSLCFAVLWFLVWLQKHGTCFVSRSVEGQFKGWCHFKSAS